MIVHSFRFWLSTVAVFLAMVMAPTVNAAGRSDYDALVYQVLPVNASAEFVSAATPGFTHPAVNLKIPAHARYQNPQLRIEPGEGGVLSSVLLLNDEFTLLQPASGACSVTSCALPPEATYAIVQVVNSASASRGAPLRVELTTKQVRYQVSPISGWYASVGGTFSGDTIADNPDGDSYRAGGGGRFFGGYSFKLNRFNLRTGFGFRYQGGVGEIRGAVAQLQLSGQLGNANIGVGLLADTGGEVTSEFGETTRFDSNITPEIFFEYPAGERIDLGLNLFVNSEYTGGDNDRVYQGPKVGLYVVFGGR